jgi:hypothetical protein
MNISDFYPCISFAKISFERWCFAKVKVQNCSFEIVFSPVFVKLNFWSTYTPESWKIFELAAWRGRLWPTHVKDNKAVFLYKFSTKHSFTLPTLPVYVSSWRSWYGKKGYRKKIIVALLLDPEGMGCTKNVHLRLITNFRACVCKTQHLWVNENSVIQKRQKLFVGVENELRKRGFTSRMHLSFAIRKCKHEFFRSNLGFIIVKSYYFVSSTLGLISKHNVSHKLHC